jgi:hypothetical protein
MAKIHSLKIGVGAGAMLLGSYLALNFKDNFFMVIIGIVLAAFGVALIASS